MILSERLFIPAFQPSTHPRTEINSRSNGLFHAHDHRQLGMVGMEIGERDAVNSCSLDRGFVLCGGLADDHRHAAPYEALACCLFNFGHAPLGWKLLELKSIVAGHHAIRRPGKINHPGLCGDVGRMIGFTERSAGQVR